ncbi:SgcJ/EcaC family oxidoreductase [Streptomyces sp. NPDC001868]|uniref:SgcJ/EcaC family oxidoreductase n=1 Tax=Streptomyces sp. NPDC001868 TaxID=3154401 RepID=UPI00332F6B9D
MTSHVSASHLSASRRPASSSARPHTPRRSGRRRPLALAAALLFTLVMGANAATATATSTTSGAVDGHRAVTGSGSPTESALPQLKRLIERQADAWNRGDGTAFANTYAEDAEFITFDGTHLRGRPEMARNFQLYFDHYTKGTRLVFTKVPVTLRHPTPRTAVMITTGCIANPGEPECRPDSHSIQTYVASYGKRGWELVSFQNTRVQGLLPPPRA